MNNNWRNLFNAYLLQKGKDILKRDGVKGFVSKADICMARVRTNREYNVKIGEPGNDFPLMSCNCLIAGNGMRCEHEAAVMLYLEQQEKKNNKKTELVLKTDKGDTFFNLRTILDDYEIESEDIEEAQKLAKSGNLAITDVKMSYISSDDGDKQALQVTGSLSGNRSYSVTVKLFFTRDRMLNSDCFADHMGRSYYGYYAYDHLCVHKLALALLTDEYIAKYNPGDATDFRGSVILKSFRKQAAIQKIDEENEKHPLVRLEPRISIGDRYNPSSLLLSFKVGIEKLYILKNITDLVNVKESSGAYKLSKSATISFIENDFDEASGKYYEILKKAKTDSDYLSEKMAKLSYYYPSKSLFQVKDKIELTGDILDMLYQSAYGKTIELNGSEKCSRLKVTEGKINATVVIRQLKDKKEFNGLSVSATLPVMIKGRSSQYILDEEKGVLSKVSDISPIVKSLMDSADKHGDVSFAIGKKSLSEFYYRFLPELMECPEVEVIEEKSGSYQKFLPPECNITFYLDADENNITGRLTAKYEEEEISLHTLRESDFPLSDKRDIDFEQSAVKTLLKYLPETAEGEDVFFCEKTGDNIFDMLSEGLKELMGVGEVKASKDFERLKIRRAPAVRLGVSVESGILNLEVSTDDMTEDELLMLLESYRKKKRFFRLGNGEFIKLEQDDTLEELTATMQSMGISAKEFTKGKLHLPLYRAIYINKLLEEHDEIAADRDVHFKSLVRNFNSVKESDVEVPESLSKILRGYQAFGFKWLSMLSDLGFGGILADDMGLGKTIQVISLLVSRKELLEADNKKLRALIVSPASLVYNWEEEFKRFAPSINVRTVTGTQAERKKLLSSKELPEVLVTSYDLLKRDIGSYEDLSFDYEIIDEAQFIKNASAAASKSVKVIKAAHRFALTGTPIENRLSELWSIFDYLMPGFLYTYDRFRSDFENAITKYKDEEVTKQLRNMVGPFILRRLKGDVLKDLPDKMEEIRFSRFDKEQRKIYDAQVTHMKKMLESEDYESGKDRIKVLAELTRIRQICCDPALITEGYKGDSAKRSSCIELIQSAIDGGHKILLFSQFTSMFDLLEKDLEAYGIEYYKITGQTRKEDRIKLVHAFNENDVPLFLISLKAGGTGLNLTGADVVIHYDPWWNLAAQNQATDRAHRIGQTKKVSVFKLIAKDTIEEKIVEMQNAKRDLADAILSGESESLMNLSKDQLMELLG